MVVQVVSKISKMLIKLVISLSLLSLSGCYLFYFSKVEVVSDKSAIFLPKIEGVYYKLKSESAINDEKALGVKNKSNFKDVLYIIKCKMLNKYLLIDSIEDGSRESPVQLLRLERNVYLAQYKLPDQESNDRKYMLMLWNIENNSITWIANDGVEEEIEKKLLKSSNVKKNDNFGLEGDSANIILFLRSLSKNIKLVPYEKLVRIPINRLELDHYIKSVNVENKEMIVKRKHSIHEAVEGNNLERVKLLLKKYPSWLYLKTESGESLLQLAEKTWKAIEPKEDIQRNKMLEVIRLLIQKGADRSQIQEPEVLEWLNRKGMQRKSS